MSAVIAVLLAVLVLGAWLGVAGFARLRGAFDRMHCVAFVNVAAGLPLIVAAFLADGASVRAGKILLIVAVNLLAGAATSHAVGRAILQRGPETRDAPPAGQGRAGQRL